MKASEVLDRSVEKLTSQFCEEAREEALSLLSQFLEISTPQLLSHLDLEISEENFAKISSLLELRAQGTPLAHCLGFCYFLNQKFQVDSSVLIPRADSESMVMFARQFLERNQGPLRVLDLGCGSGALGICTILPFENVELVGMDISLEAVEKSQSNANNLSLKGRSSFLRKDLDKEDLLDQDPYDVIIANPPYIDFQDQNLAKSVREYEPHLALFAEDQGLAKIKTWTLKGIKILRPGGIFLSEIGWKQRPALEEWFASNQLSSVKFYQDISGKDRFFEIKKN